MKTAKLLVIASVAAASFGAFAQGQSQEGSYLPDQAQSSASAAQVRAELAAYKKAGVNPWSTSYNQLRDFRSARTRAEVSGEYVASRDEVAALNREDSGSAYLTQLATRPHRIDQNLAGQPANTAK